MILPFRCSGKRASNKRSLSCAPQPRSLYTKILQQRSRGGTKNIARPLGRGELAVIFGELSGGTYQEQHETQ